MIPDNDEPGRRHVQAVAQKLSRHAASIRVLELPGLPPKGDVSDWLADGGTRDKLEELTASAPYWHGEPDGDESSDQVDDGEDSGGQQQEQAKPNAKTAWPDPIDIIGAPELTGWPALTAECLPEPLHRYVMAEAERLNVDPCPLAVTCSRPAHLDQRCMACQAKASRSSGRSRRGSGPAS